MQVVAIVGDNNEVNDNVSTSLQPSGNESDFSEINYKDPSKQLKAVKNVNKIDTSDKSVTKADTSTSKIVSQPELYICEICGNFYNKKYQLRRHVEFHSNLKPFECE